MLAVLRKNYQPDNVVLFRSSREEKPAIFQAAPFTGAQKPLKGMATAYVCRNHVCNFPTNDPGRMMALLRKSAL